MSCIFLIEIGHRQHNESCEKGGGCPSRPKPHSFLGKSIVSNEMRQKLRHGLEKTAFDIHRKHYFLWLAKALGITSDEANKLHDVNLLDLQKLCGKKYATIEWMSNLKDDTGLHRDRIETWSCGLFTITQKQINFIFRWIRYQEEADKSDWPFIVAAGLDDKTVNEKRERLLVAHGLDEPTIEKERKKIFAAQRAKLGKMPMP